MNLSYLKYRSFASPTEFGLYRFAERPPATRTNAHSSIPRETFHWGSSGIFVARFSNRQGLAAGNPASSGMLAPLSRGDDDQLARPSLPILRLYSSESRLFVGEEPGPKMIVAPSVARGPPANRSVKAKSATEMPDELPLNDLSILFSSSSCLSRCSSERPGRHNASSTGKDRGSPEFESGSSDPRFPSCGSPPSPPSRLPKSKRDLLLRMPLHDPVLPCLSRPDPKHENHSYSERLNFHGAGHFEGCSTNRNASLRAASAPPRHPTAVNASLRYS